MTTDPNGGECRVPFTVSKFVTHGGFDGRQSAPLGTRRPRGV